MVLDVLAKLKKKGISFSELIRNISPYFSSGELNYTTDRKQQAMDALVDYFSSQEKATSLLDFDGYRVDFEHWWFNVRPSNTEPYLRFIAEADSEKQLALIIGKANELLKLFLNS